MRQQAGQSACVMGGCPSHSSTGAHKTNAGSVLGSWPLTPEELGLWTVSRWRRGASGGGEAEVRAGGLLSPGVRVQWGPGLPDRRGLCPCCGL